MWGYLPALPMLFTWQNSDELQCSQVLEPHLPLLMGAQKRGWRCALRETVQPILPWEILSPTRVNKSYFFQGSSKPVWVLSLSRRLWIGQLMKVYRQAIRGQIKITVAWAWCGHGDCEALYSSTDVGTPLEDSQLHIRWTLPLLCNLPQCSPYISIFCGLMEVLLVLFVSGVLWWWPILGGLPVQRQQGQRGLC